MALLAILLGFLALILIVLLIWVHLLRTHNSIRRDLSEIASRVGSHLEQTARLAQQAGEGTVKAISDVYTRLGSLEESTHKIYEVGREIGKLQDVLRAPKARGGFGELMLSDLLGQMIPQGHFQLQYAFRSGSRVDAVIFVGNHLVPIDAKFPLENFQRLLVVQAAEEKKKVRREFVRDVKKHIDAIAERYISADEGTLDFAMMYVPAENVYYEVITSAEGEGNTLSSYALAKRVVPVSPNSFYAYLQVILLGLRGLRIDQSAREIAESLTKMQSDFGKIAGDFEVLGSHLNHAKSTYEKVQQGVDRFQTKLSLVDRVKLEENEKEPLRTEELSENENK